MKIGLYLDDISLQILKNGLFVSCEPKQSILQLAPGLIDERMSEIGQIYLVANLNKQTQGKALLVDAFLTVFGDPDERLLQVLGYTDNIQKFQSEYSAFYHKQFPDDELSDDTDLFVCIYTPVADS